jgi:hypothetical protein
LEFTEKLSRGEETQGAIPKFGRQAATWNPDSLCRYDILPNDTKHPIGNGVVGFLATAANPLSFRKRPVAALIFKR